MFEFKKPMQDILSENSILKRLQELMQETDHEFILELIEIFIGETPKQIQLIADALNTHSSSALTSAAHKLKGSSMNLGAEQLGKLCLKLEELGRSNDPIPEKISTQEIEAEFEQIKMVLQKFKQSINK